MGIVELTVIFVLILYLFAIDWKSFFNYVKQGAWFFIVVYFFLGLAIYKFFLHGIGH